MNSSICFDNRKKVMQLKDPKANEDSRYGWGRLKPSCFQRLNRPWFLLLCLCIAALVHGMTVNGFVMASTSTLEKRFRFSSAEIGLINTMYDVGYAFMILPLAYFGERGHKGRWVGGGMLVVSAGAAIFALPQFAAPPYEYSGLLNDICISARKPGTPHEAQECEAYNTLALACLVIGQLLHGIGSCPLYTVGITFMDENVSQRSSPLYTGVQLVMSLIGPAIGFLGGGALLKISGDTNRKRSEVAVQLSYDDPRFVGAWWIGPLISCAVAALISVPLMGFGKTLPGAIAARQNDVDQSTFFSCSETLPHVAFDLSPPTTEHFGKQLSRLPVVLRSLLRNLTYIFCVAELISQGFIISGMLVFLSKYVENMYELAESTAVVVTGSILIPLSALGTFTGSYVQKRFNMRCKQLLTLSLLCNVVPLVGMLGFLAYCSQPIESRKLTNVVNLPTYSRFDWDQTSAVASCSQDCACVQKYNPVCYTVTKQSFFSACQAGCRNFNQVNFTWTDCLCIPFANALLTKGRCQTELCNLLPAFLVCFGLQIFFLFLHLNPMQQVMLRCVPFDQRTLAVGLSQLPLRLFGTIPAANVFGYFINRACLVWNEHCGKQQHCAVYNKFRFAVTMIGIGAVCMFLNTLSVFFARYFYKPPPTTELTNSVNVNAEMVKKEFRRKRVTEDGYEIDSDSLSTRRLTLH